MEIQLANFMCIFVTVFMHVIIVFLFHKAGILHKDLNSAENPMQKKSVMTLSKGLTYFAQ